MPPFPDDTLALRDDAANLRVRVRRESTERSELDRAVHVAVIGRCEGHVVNV
jgi:hypothetical protein